MLRIFGNQQKAEPANSQLKPALDAGSTEAHHQTDGRTRYSIPFNPRREIDFRYREHLLPGTTDFPHCIAFDSLQQVAYMKDGAVCTLLLALRPCPLFKAGS